MRKAMFISFALVLIAVGFFIGTMSSNNKAYALVGGPEIVHPPSAFDLITPAPSKSEYRQALSEITLLREELETYKALEAFWVTEVFGGVDRPTRTETINSRAPSSIKMTAHNIDLLTQ